MPTQQIRTYIDEQIKAGYSLKSIHSILVENGWPEEMVTGVMSEAVGEAESAKANNKKIFIVLAVAIVVTVLSIGGVVAYQFMDTTPVVRQDLTDNSQSDTVAMETAQKEVGQQPEIFSPESEQSESAISPTEMSEISSLLAENIENCTPKVIAYQHPLIDEIHTKEILGLKNNLCHYKETLPNGGLIECYFSKTQQLAIAEHAMNLENVSEIGVSVSSDLSPSGSDTTITETHDGNVVTNPWNDAFADGTCVVSGY